MTDELSNIIFERTFEAVDSDGSARTITLCIGKPYRLDQTKSELNWCCPYQIVGIGSGTIKEAPGRDALDALLISLRIANEFLKSYSQRTTITWLGEEKLGFHHLAQTETSDAVDNNPDSPFNQIFDQFFHDFLSKLKKNNGELADNE